MYSHVARPSNEKEEKLTRAHTYKPGVLCGNADSPFGSVQAVAHLFPNKGQEIETDNALVSDFILEGS